MTHTEYLVNKRGYKEATADAYAKIVEAMPVDAPFDFKLSNRNGALYCELHGWKTGMAYHDYVIFIRGIYPNAIVTSAAISTHSGVKFRLNP